MIEIYKASAGSGKTFTLTREYIKFILGRKDGDGRYRLNTGDFAGHRSVLAITFTNKATEEMKERIIHELAVIAGAEPGWDDPSPYMDYLCREFSCGTEELVRAAGKALRALLFDFDRFGVSTIDAFFQTVLRAFAHEADVSGSYEVELDDTSVMSMGIDRMLQDLNRNPGTSESRHLIGWLTRYMFNLIEEGKTFNVFNRSSEVHKQLVKFIVGVMDDTFKAHSGEIMAYLNDRERFRQFIEATDGRRKKVKRDTALKCRAALEAIERSGARDIINSNVVSPIRNWGETGYYKTKSLSATLLKAHADIGSAYKKSAGKKLSLRSPELDAAISDAIGAINVSFGTVKELSIITANLYQLGLVGAIMEYVDRYRRENSTILLSDTNALLAGIIGDDDAPFLYEKIGNTYRNFLIDEFQDTSHSQWQNLRPLLGESLATDNDNLVIGDEKQCIYRFRDSDPSLLQYLHEDRVAAGRCRVKGGELSENTNWRSSSHVVRFNNTLFTAIAGVLDFDDTYSNVVQQVSPKHIDHKGYIRVNVYPDSKESDPREAALDTLVSNLRRQLESGYKPGDIAILVRQWKEGDAVIARLEQTRLDDPTFPPFTIVSDKSLLVSRSKAVMLIVSQLRFMSLTNFTPDKHKRSRKEVARMINEYEAAVSRNMQPSEALLAAVASLGPAAPAKPADEDAAAYEGMDLVSLVESIIATSVTPENMEKDNIYITAFQDLVVDFMAKGRADIRSFLEWWDDKGCKVSVSGAKDDNALNILTIHKSKGLEYSCVHVPFAECSESNIPDTEWFRLEGIDGVDPSIVPPWLPLTVTSDMKDTSFAPEYEVIVREKQLDRLNLLYVAFTRAVDELIIGVKVPAKDIEGKGESSDGPLSVPRFLFRALSMCDDAYVAGLCSREGIAPGAANPFITFGFDSDMLIEVGAPTLPRAKERKKTSAMAPSVTRPEGRYRIFTNNSIWENTRLDRGDFSKALTARERGLIIHDILSRVVRASDVDGALNILHTLPATIGAGKDEKDEIGAIVRQRVSDPLVRDWFEGFTRVLIEREVMTGNGNVKRFDRVVWTASGEIHLVDYKSGSQPPKRYVKQIKGYIEFFKSIGYPKVRGFLYYLDTGKVIEIS